MNKECLASLHLDNTRYDKISGEHKGSFEWIWAHSEYRSWSKLDASRLLYIPGKPGSGKSTLTKYFNNNLLEREAAAKSAIVAKFFYSSREGILQTSHYSMLQSVLYDILNQDEFFFYHRFQPEYRDYLAALQERSCGGCVDWHYKSLKRVLSSLWDYSLAERLYLIIDAVDESDEKDRRDILNLLFNLCSKSKYCIVKVFIASRPVGQVELRRSEFHNFIRLQDMTKSDISSFACSFLSGLNLSCFLTQATEYIVENAQGVFLWVRLVGEELLAREEQGYAEEDIFQFLKSLPTELGEFYTRMFEKMKGKELNLQDGVKMFRFVLFGRRPLTVDELLHSLGIPDNIDIEFTPSDDSFQRRIPSERRIIHCGGNFLEIRPHNSASATYDDYSNPQTNKLARNGTVQVMHQTVHEFFLRPGGCVADSEFKMSEKDAHKCISIVCIRYLMLCAANTTLAKRLPHIEFWTSEHFRDYAQYLDERPFANYALCYLNHHIDGCHRDANISNIISQFIDKLTDPAVYLLESWVSSHRNKTLLNNDQDGAAEDFRNKVLHAAARRGCLAAAEVLLTVGANVNARGEGGWTALSLAAARGHEAVVKLLLACNDVVADSEDEDGWTPLSWAAAGGHEAVVKQLLARNDIGADSKGGMEGWTPLSRAAAGGHEAVVKLLLAHNDVEADLEDVGGRTPISLAAAGGHEAVVKLLLARNDVEADSKDKDGWTLLSWAAAGGHEAVVRLLLARNDVEADSQGEWDGWTPLTRAAAGGHEAVVKLLLARNDVKADSKDKGRRTPLWWAAEGGHEAVVKQLLARNDVKADLKGEGGRTPLSRAAAGGHEAVVKLLLARNDVEADSKDEWDGWTPLWWAAAGGHEAVVKRLLARNDVKANLKDKGGRTLLSWAAAGEHEAVVKLLQSHSTISQLPLY
jgi:ankyrin repeat domain-containing protein 50